MNFIEKIKEEYLKAHNECDIHKGDLVKITQPFTTDKAGCEIVWTNEMKSTVGVIGEVTIKTDGGFFVRTIYGEYAYPFFVLEKVKKEEEQFKPGELVIAPIYVSGDYKKIWIVTVYSHSDGDGHITATGVKHFTCKKLEGNEHLVGKLLEE